VGIKLLDAMEDLQTVDAGQDIVDAGQDISNSYLAAIYSNGEMKQCEDGVHFEGPTPTLFRIPYNSTLWNLKEKVCRSLDIPHGSNINKLCYRKPTMTEKGTIIYSAAYLTSDEEVIAMIMSKPTFPINTIIELFVSFTRSADEIFRLLHWTPHCSLSEVEDK